LFGHFQRMLAPLLGVQRFVRVRHVTARVSDADAVARGTR
jgi:hypothetical protein